MDIYFIRHGETAGNLEKRYIGVTNESLCRQGQEHVKALKKDIEALLCEKKETLTVYVSPLKRCKETAGILFPGQALQVERDLRECCFGSFEGHSYQELNGDPQYQAWIDSGGELPFPGEADLDELGRTEPGESKKEFSSRCASAFQRIIEREAEADGLAFVVHGGTIMAIMEAFAQPQKSYYNWMLGPAEGYYCRWSPEIQKLEFVSHVPTL